MSSTCFELGLVNNYDGFNVNPRFTVKFSGPVDVKALKAGIYYIALNNLTNEEVGLNRLGHVIGANKLFYALTNTAYGPPALRVWKGPMEGRYSFRRGLSWQLGSW